MLTGKQRAALNKEAISLDTILFIGKGEIDDDIIRQAGDALKARELIKCKVLDNSGYTAREAAEIIAEKTGSDTVRVIGSKFILYKRNVEKGKYDHLL